MHACTQSYIKLGLSERRDLHDLAGLLNTWVHVRHERLKLPQRARHGLGLCWIRLLEEVGLISDRRRVSTGCTAWHV